MDAAPGHSVCVFAINTGPGSGTSVGCRRVEDPLALLRTTGGLTGPVPASATGRLAVVPGSTNPPREARRTVRVRVEVEAGLPVDGAVLADVAMTTLNGTRGWGADGSVTFRPNRRRGRRPPYPGLARDRGRAARSPADERPHVLPRRGPGRDQRPAQQQTVVMSGCRPNGWPNP